MAAATRDKRFGELIDYIETFDELVARLYAFPRPLVAAIEGHASTSRSTASCNCFPNPAGSVEDNSFRIIPCWSLSSSV